MRRTPVGGIMLVVERDNPLQLKREEGVMGPMLFHVSVEAYGNIVLDADKRLREMVGPQLQKVMESGKVREAGILASKRGGFFLVDIDAPEELYELFGPEVYGSFAVDAQPVVPVEKAGRSSKVGPLKAGRAATYPRPAPSSVTTFKE
jgi:hypothetical protein